MEREPKWNPASCLRRSPRIGRALVFLELCLLGTAIVIFSDPVAEVVAEPKRAPARTNPFPAPLAESTPLDTERIAGITIGPVESSLHPGKGYGSAAFQTSVRRVRRLGANWVSLTPFGRIWDLSPTGVDLRFEAPPAENARNLERSIALAKAQGHRVMLVPHLWAETGGWRGEIDPRDAAGWKRWAAGYERFLLFWTKVAARTNVDVLAMGVELRTWVTTTHAPSFVELIHKVRRIYPGTLTYAANWDDAEDTVIWSELDWIGINAFFPLAEREGEEDAAMLDKSTEVALRLEQLAHGWNKPILFTEIGYTTRPDPALRPWEWPDSMQGMRVDQVAQARAFRALLSPFFDRPWFLGFFVWRSYADPHDMSQEAEWGFNPLGKWAEIVVRDAFCRIRTLSPERSFGLGPVALPERQTSLPCAPATHVGRY